MRVIESDPAPKIANIDRKLSLKRSRPGQFDNAPDGAQNTSEGQQNIAVAKSRIGKASGVDPIGERQSDEFDRKRSSPE
jgi:hypothetical protein